MTPTLRIPHPDLRRWCLPVALAARLLPAPERRGALALWNFALEAATRIAAAQAESGSALSAAHLGLVAEVAAVYSPEPPADLPARLATLRETVGQRGIPRRRLAAIADGCLMHAMNRSFRDWRRLEGQLQSVGGAAALAIGSVFLAPGATPPSGLAALGVGVQLAHGIRFLPLSLAEGRVPFPAEDLERFHVSDDVLVARLVTPHFQDLIQFEIRRARALLVEGEAALAELSPPGRALGRVLCRTEEALLDRIEASGYRLFDAPAAIGLRESVSIVAREWRCTDATRPAPGR